MLLVIAMKKCQLLLAVGRVVEGIDVDGDLGGPGLERGDELIEEHIAKAQQVFGVDAVFKA